MTNEVISVKKPAARKDQTEAQDRLVMSGSGGPECATSRSSELLQVGKSEQPIERALNVAGPESILGVDQRTRILETELDPWRRICALRMFKGSRAAIGTGWLVGPRTVITAGHCVYSLDFFGGWADRVEVSPGRSGSTFPHGTLVSEDMESVDRWVSDEDPDFDIGCIHLSEPIGEQTGWFSIGSLSESELAGYNVNISGYPGDRGNGEEQWFHSNRVLHASSRRLFYDVDTFGGQSGAPVFVYETRDSQPLVVGIHAYGTGGTPMHLGIRANSAPRIIPEVFNQIGRWIESDS